MSCEQIYITANKSGGSIDNVEKLSLNCILGTHVKVVIEFESMRQKRTSEVKSSECPTMEDYDFQLKKSCCFST